MVLSIRKALELIFKWPIDQCEPRILPFSFAMNSVTNTKAESVWRESVVSQAGDPAECRPHLVFVVPPQGELFRQFIFHGSTWRECEVTSFSNIVGQGYPSATHEYLSIDC